jgi:hypothetical protein
MVPEYAPIEDQQLALLAQLFRQALAGQVLTTELEATLKQRLAPVYVELRNQGRLVASAWNCSGNQWQSLCVLLDQLRGGAAGATELLVCLLHRPQEMNLSAEGWSNLTANVMQGIRAHEFCLAERAEVVQRVSPFEVVAQNRTFEKFFSSFAATNHLTSDLARQGEVLVHEFKADQFWIDLSGRRSAATRLFRGCRLVSDDEIDPAFVEHLGALMSDYLINAVQADGRIVYQYYPSSGTEDRSRNNAIRQWMATRALIRIDEWRQDQGVLERLHKNIAFNLNSMYAIDAGFGMICEGDKVKLGAIALAALSLLECPFAEEYTDVRDRLLATITYLWQDSGEFHTFYRPASRMDCQNFYPGEALLLWSHLIPTHADASLTERFWRSFEYYQAWHLANRNPAFIPWHTQAYANMWRLTHDKRLPQAIFAMNDWLLPIQQWESAPQPDCRGRFYDPHRPFGPPHASSTAVYLEGLVDAFATAKELCETERADRYRKAIRRGLRSLAQLTYKDDCDLSYITKKNAARGGVRTTEYNNAIRIDSVQHAFMAVQKVLKLLFPSN